MAQAGVCCAGEKPGSVQGHLELREVGFAYPQRREVAVFSKLSLAVEAGTTLALVGPSGSGKSTVVSLVQRFYDPTSGQVQPCSRDVPRMMQLSCRWPVHAHLPCACSGSPALGGMSCIPRHGLSRGLRPCISPAGVVVGGGGGMPSMTGRQLASPELDACGWGVQSPSRLPYSHLVGRADTAGWHGHQAAEPAVAEGPHGPGEPGAHPVCGHGRSEHRLRM